MAAVAEKSNAAPDQDNTKPMTGRVDAIDQGRIFGWAFDPAEGSQFLDWGVHAIDALRWWTGAEVERVYADYRTYGTPPPADQSAMVQVRLTDGVMAQILMTYELPEPGLPPADTTLLIGSEGMIDCDHYGSVRLGRGDGWTESGCSPRAVPRSRRKVEARRARRARMRSCFTRSRTCRRALPTWS